MRVGELGRFGAAGLVASAADVALFHLLVLTGVPALVANPVSMALRLLLAFWLTRSWVFRDREVRETRVELPLFLLVAVSNIVVVELVLVAAQFGTGGELAPVPATAVKVCAVGVTFFARYLVSRRWVFKAD